MHYLISESLFLVYVPLLIGGPFQPEQLNSSDTIIQVGYSCIAIFASIFVGTAALLILNLTVIFRRYDPNIPLVGSCSAAISAACHPPESDQDAAWKNVRWGVVKDEKSGEVGHCSLTSFEVEEPVTGRLYA